MGKRKFDLKKQFRIYVGYEIGLNILKIQSDFDLLPKESYTYLGVNKVF